jgi:hypothetical protein
VRSSVSLALCVALVAASPALARAQGLQTVPTGGRSTLMGATGIARGNDSAAPFYNPAATLNVKASLGLSLNVINVEWLKLTLTQPIDPALGVSDVATSKEKIVVEGIPSTLCLFADLPRIGKGAGRTGLSKVAGCFGTASREQISFLGNGALYGDVRQTGSAVNFTRVTDRFVGAVTFAVHVLDRLVLGASLQGYSTTVSLQSNGGTTSFGDGRSTTATAYGNGAGGNSIGVGMSLGATLELHPVTFGLVVQTGDLNVWGQGATSGFSQYSLGATQDYSQVYRYSGGFLTALPWRAGLGVAFETERLKTEVDLSLSFPRGDGFRTDFTSGGTVTAINGVSTATQTPLRIDEAASWVGAIGVGAEYFTSPAKKFSVLGGLSATMTPLGSQRLDFYPIRENRFGFSVGMGAHTAAGTLMLGVQTSYGIGKTAVPNPYALPPQYGNADTDIVRVLFVLAGTTSFQALKEAAEDAIGVKKEPGKPGDPKAPGPPPPAK